MGWNENSCVPSKMNFFVMCCAYGSIKFLGSQIVAIRKFVGLIYNRIKTINGQIIAYLNKY